ncbi:MAG: TonB-denpendent receptor, partial [Gammaproteobacteria bacterium]
MQHKTLFLALATLWSTIGLAQDLGENSGELNTVVVESVYAVPAQRDNTGATVTVLTEKDFSARDATYVTDVLKTVSGIAVGATGGHGAQTSVFMRGADSDQTLVVIDGVKMNPASGGSFDFGTLPLSNVARIEILRGEQSALWGSDA